MNHWNKHEKVAKILSQTTLENFIESLNAIEYNLNTSIQNSASSPVPQEANFQLPNVFLKTKLNHEAEKILGNVNYKANWNSQIEKIIQFLDEIEVEITSFRTPETSKEKEIEEMIKLRGGI